MFWKNNILALLGKGLVITFSLALISLAVISAKAESDCVTNMYGYRFCNSDSISITRTSNTEGTVFHEFYNYLYIDAVEYVSGMGIVKGYEDGTFRPNNLLNRAEFTKILVEAITSTPPPKPTKACFDDVPRTQWFAPYVCYAKEQNIIGGYPDGEFKPSNNINFAEAAKIIISSFNFSVRELRRGEKWFVPYILTLSQKKAIPGTINDVGHLLTRGEMAELIMRIKSGDTSKSSLTGCDLTSSLCSTRYRDLKDLDGSPFKDSIAFLQRRGVVDGYNDRTFKPNDLINRAEIVKIILGAIIKVEGVIGEEEDCFEDVGTQWFAPYVCYAKEGSIIKGYSDGTFRPGQNVNMAEAMKIVFEAFGFTELEARPNQQWYEPYVDFSHENNIFSKYNYLPDKLITRGEMAYLIQRLIYNKAELQLFNDLRDNRSAGCGKFVSDETDPDSLVEGMEIRDSIHVDGQDRYYLAYVPDTYDENVPLSIIFTFHGRTDGYDEIGYFGMDDVAGKKAIVVSPAALYGANDWSYQWVLDRDAVFFDHLLEEIASNYCVDLDQVYLVGHSLGAWMANSLSCVRGGAVRAVGSVGGGTTYAECSGPVAAISFHNPKDDLSPFSSGESSRDRYLSQNVCTDETREFDGPAKANCMEYTECNSRAPVMWCPHTEDEPFGYYYPHGWPGFASDLIWDFFTGLE